MSEEDLRIKILKRLHDEGEIAVGHDIGKLSRDIAAMAIEHFRTIHSKALACHCECLGMNAENCISACKNEVPPFTNAYYIECMQKWGLVDEKGKSII